MFALFVKKDGGKPFQLLKSFEGRVESVGLTLEDLCSPAWNPFLEALDDPAARAVVVPAPQIARPPRPSRSVDILPLRFASSNRGSVVASESSKGVEEQLIVLCTSDPELVVEVSVSVA